MENLPGIYRKRLESVVRAYVILLLWRITPIYESMPISFEVNYYPSIPQFKFVSSTVK
jgi:hypothetical protein